MLKPTQKKSDKYGSWGVMAFYACIFVATHDSLRL